MTIIFTDIKSVFCRTLTGAFALVLCLSIPPARASMGGQIDLRTLVIETNPGDFYAELLRQSTDYVFEAVPSVALNKYKLWRCLILDPGSEEHHFLIAVSPAKDEALILTDSVAAFNQVIARESLCVLDGAQATLIAMESLLLTRPYFKRFVIISSVAELGLYGDVSGFSVSPLKMHKDGDSFIGKVLVLVGVDLVERTVVLSKSGGVSFFDRILARQFAQPASPHG